MSKKMKFIWVDDNSQRAIEANNLAQRLGVLIAFKDVRNKYLDEVLSGILDRYEPDLILIDHRLEDVSSGIFKFGSTAAAFIRESWPQCPVVCITGVDKSEVDSQQRALYEEMYLINKISNYDKTIFSVAKGFKQLKEKPPKDVNDLLKFLKAPPEDYERLKSILPRELKENFNDKTLLLEISHWIRKVLMNRPGFLYDRLWAATLLGIKEESFSKVENLFKSAKYKGIFENETDERWWKSKLLSVLSALIQEHGLSWEKGES